MNYSDVFFELLLVAAVVCLIGWPIMLVVALVQCLSDGKQDVSSSGEALPLVSSQN